MGFGCQHWEVLKSIHQILFSIAMGKGQIIMGLPEDSEGQNLGGSIQTFINAGWQQRGTEVPTNDNGFLDNGFLIEEDDEQGLIIDFNATHPFDSDLLWQIDGHDSNTGVLEFNNSSGF